MANEIEKIVWRNGVRGTVAYDEASFTAITSTTSLYDICLAKMADLGMTDANIPGNATMAGLATNISNQAQTDGLLV